MGDASTVIRGALTGADSNEPKIIRLSPVLAQVWLKLLEAYQARNAPLSAEVAAEIVRLHSKNTKNPFSTLHTLGARGVLQLSNGNGKNRGRIPLTIGIVILTGESENERQIWPVTDMKVEKTMTGQPKPVSKKPKPPQDVRCEPVVQNPVSTKEELQARLESKQIQADQLTASWREIERNLEEDVAALEREVPELERRLAECKMRLTETRKALETNQLGKPEGLDDLRHEIEDLSLLVPNYDRFVPYLRRS